MKHEDTSVARGTCECEFTSDYQCLFCVQEEAKRRRTYSRREYARELAIIAATLGIHNAEIGIAMAKDFITAAKKQAEADIK